MSWLLTLSTAAMLGFLHAIEVDHMIAVTTFVSRRPALRSAAIFGARWGVGHSVAVLIAGGILVATGLRWPERYDAYGEAAVGLVLVGLGVWALVSARRLHLHPPEEHGDHAHLHVHADGAGHAHEHHHHHGHADPGRVPHRHGHGITLVGLLHGLAGTSAVVALLPVTLIQRKVLGLGYLVCFGLGTTAGMMLFAVIAAAAMRQAADRSVRLGRLMAMLVGLAGIGVGLWWIGRAGLIG